MQMGSVDECRPGEDAKHAEAPTFHPTGVEKLSHSQHGRHSAFDHGGERRLSAKHWIRIWQVNPTISQFLSVENV